MRRIVHAVLAAAVLAVTATASAGVTTGSGIDLSTDAAVASYLASRGIDPTSVVIQRGAKNYAGPACPGADWNCTTATHVVQVASEGGENRFECDPEGVPDPYDDPLVEDADVECFVVAEAEEGNVHGRCVQKVYDSPEIVLYCDMTLAGDNTFAHVDQSVIQREGSHQDAEVVARVRQSATMANHLQLTQTVSQSSDEVDSPAAGVVSLADEGPAQDQSGRLRSEVTQHAGKTNETHFFQDLNQRAGTGGAAVGGSVVREQFGDHLGEVFQTISSGDSANKFHAHQSERQTITGGGVKRQNGGEFCCATQSGGDPNQNQLAIHQDKFQKCEEPKPEPVTPTCEQHSSATGQYFTPGGPILTAGGDDSTGPSKFHILHHLANNVDRITARESGPGPHMVATTCHSVPPEDEDEVDLLSEHDDDVGCVSSDEHPEGDDTVDFIEHAVPAIEWP